MVEFPEWMKENEDGTFTIHTRHGEYVMEEQVEEVLTTCSRLSEKLKIPMESLLAVKSLIRESKMSDEDFSKLKGSVSTRLKIATTYLYDLGDFLTAHKKEN